MGGGKSAKQFFRKLIVRAKNVGKNRRKEVRKTFFLFNEYRDHKMVGKTRETIFPETHE